MSDFCFATPALNDMIEQLGLMDRMMAAAGVEAADVVALDEGASWFEARLRCLECPSVRECRAWLAVNAGRSGRRVPELCPNRPLFAALSDSSVPAPTSREPLSV